MPNPKTLSRQNKIKSLVNINRLSIDLILLDHKDRDKIDGRKFKAIEKDMTDIKKEIIA